MDKCPGCGSEIVFGARNCWECNEPLKLDAPVEFEPLDGIAIDADLEGAVLEKSHERAPNLVETAPGVGAVEEVPSSAVVAFVAQDEVQAGTISQLLSDCGIENFASLDEDHRSETLTPGATPRMSVQVSRKDLAAAQQIIADFTSQFEEPAE